MSRAINANVAAALLDEKLRIKSILTSAEAEGRAALAMTLALDSSMGVEEAAGILRSAAKEQTGGSRFLAAMNAEGRIGLDGLSADAGVSDSKEKRKAELAAAADHVRVTRYGLTPKAKKPA